MGVTFIAPQGTYTAPAKLVSKSITKNGTYDATDDSANGYSSVTVNVEGGGSSWQTVFEGSVTTVDDDGDIFGIIEDLTLTGDSVKASLNGIEYILPKTEHGYGAENESGLDFSTYPLFIAVGEGFCNLWTPTAGTYTLKIEEPQSGGSSDFSTAEVTFICSSNEPEINLAFINVQNDGIYSLVDITESTQTVTVPLYKNKLSCGIGPFYMTVTSTSGNITGSQMDGYIITGNCTINYSLPM